MRFTVPSLLVAACLVAIAACSETVDSRYKSYPEAVAAGAVSRGWVPSWLPHQASEILEVHDIDTNAVMLRFSYPKGLQVRPPANCHRTTAAEVKAAPFKRAWWPDAIPARSGGTANHEYWKCADQCVAILADQQQGFVWSSK
jgi:hypothetical protein